MPPSTLLLNAHLFTDTSRRETVLAFLWTKVKMCILTKFPLLVL